MGSVNVMSGKVRPSLRAKTLENVKRSDLSQTDKDCIAEVFRRFENMVPAPRATRGLHVGDKYYCSNCGFLVHCVNFCEMCGAVMNGEGVWYSSMNEVIEDIGSRVLDRSEDGNG